METARCRAVLAAAETGSFSKAAEVLRYTPSGVNQLVTALENELGFALFRRNTKGVALTENGELLLPTIREFLRQEDRIFELSTEINGLLVGSVTIASYSSIATHWLPEVIQQFRRAHPDVGVDIQMGSVQEVYRWVQEGRVDMCFASRQESVALDWMPLKDDELLAILPPDYDNGGRSVFPVEDFDGREFLMPSMGFNLDIMRVLNRHGVTPLIRTTQVSDSVIISMVEHGLGVSMLSCLVLQGRQDDVQALPLAPRAVRELGIASRPRRDLRPMVRRFIAEAEEMIEKM